MATDMATDMATERLIVFDTTLRDGEQAPGCSMTGREKLRVARALAELGVDVIEAGFPAASEGDFESVRLIAREVRGPAICGLARCGGRDIERAWQALCEAEKPRLHVFIATSPIHREFKLGLDRDEVLRRAVEGVRVARALCADVEFSAEDAARTELDYLAEVVAAVIEAGATTVNIPDTVGYTVPEEFAERIAYLREHVHNIERAVLRVHCHDDLGLAVANSLAAVRAGARQVECTINGIGERAGNCALEEVVMAVRTRADQLPVHTGLDTTRLYPTSRLVSSITGIHIPRNKAVVGENAFAHEAGIHQHGMLKHASTYEIMRPEDVGISRSNLVLGKHSGRHAFRDRVRELGFDLDDFELNRAFQEFKKLADRKKELYDADIEALILNAEGTAPGPWVLEVLNVNSGTGSTATASVRLRHENGDCPEEAAVGDGPIAAACQAVERITGIHLVLRNFDLRSVTKGEDAQGEATVTVEYNGVTFRGHGVSTDIVEAGALAWLEVTNRIIRRQQSGLEITPAPDAGEIATI